MSIYSKLIFIYAAYQPFEELVLKYIPKALYTIVRFGFEGLFYLLFLFVLADKVTKGQKWTKTFMDLPVILFIISATLSGLWNEVGNEATILGMRAIIRYLAVYYVIVQSDYDGAKIESFLKIFLAVGAIQVVAGAVQAIGGNSVRAFFTPVDVVVAGKMVREGVITLSDDGLFIPGTLVRSTVYGTFMGMIFLYFLAKSFVYKNINLYYAMGIVSIALLFANLRKAIIGIFIAYVYGMFLTKRKLNLAISVILGFCSVITAYIILSEAGLIDLSILERVYEVFTPEYLYHSLSRTRFYVLTEILYIILSQKLIFGFGPGMIGSGLTGTSAGESAYLNVQSSVINIFDDRVAFVSDVGLVAIFGQFGIFGIISIILMHIRLFKYSIYTYKNSKYNDVKHYSIFVCFLVILMGITNIFGYSITYRIIAFYFFAITGYFVKLNIQLKKTITY